MRAGISLLTLIDIVQKNRIFVGKRMTLYNEQATPRQAGLQEAKTADSQAATPSETDQ